jgi:hypothetical protein
LSAVDAVSLQAALLRTQLPDVTLRPGQKVVARVIEQQGGRGLISLAGATLAAQLPEEVEAGAKLRLQVDEVGPERVVLRTLEQAAVPLAVPLPLPAGEQAALRVDDDEDEDGQGGDGQGEGESVALVYDTPRLGPLHLKLELTREAIRATVQARAGEPYELAEARAEELREALADATGREAAVTVRPRREPLDVYA